MLRERRDLISSSSKRTIEHQRIVSLVLIIFLDLNQFFRDITEGPKIQRNEYVKCINKKKDKVMRSKSRLSKWFYHSVHFQAIVMSFVIVIPLIVSSLSSVNSKFVLSYLLLDIQYLA